MLFFFKNKKLVVDAFIGEEYIHAYNYAPIDHANKFYPEWWKKLPKVEFDWDQLNRTNETMRTCSGFLDHYSKGLIIPMWSDLAIRTERMMFKYQFSDEISRCEWHDLSQRIGFYNDHMNVKIISPWLLSSEKNIHFTYIPAFWNNETKPEYEIAMGTISGYYQHATHINLLIRGDKEIMIPFRQPMVHLIPNTDREIDLRRHVIPKNEVEKIRNKSASVSFVGSYQKVKKYRDNTEKSKCPFHKIIK